MTQRRRSRNPFRLLRDRLAEIERNSATRPGDRWRRANEYALLFSLPVAIVLGYLFDDLDVTVEREQNVMFRIGREGIDGPVIVVRHDPEYDQQPWAMTLPLGTVMVETRLIRRGWPVASVVERPAPRLVMTLILAPDRRIALADRAGVVAIESETGVSLDGVREAVIDTLEGATSLANLASAIRRNETTTTRSWGASIAAGGATWLLLFVVSTIAIRTAQLTAWMHARLRRRRVVRRLRAGRCPDCLYDLHLERFPKRCPECGRRIWS